MRLEHWSIERLQANDRNYRAHPPAQLEHLRASLAQFGQFKNVIARPDGMLLAGHGVVEAARAEGLAEVAVYVFEGTDAQARKLMVADNETVRLAVDDDAKLADLLKELDAEGELLGTGFDEAALDKLLEETADLDLVALQAEHTSESKRGQLASGDNEIVAWGSWAVLPIDRQKIGASGRQICDLYGTDSRLALMTLIEDLANGRIHRS